MRIGIVLLAVLSNCTFISDSKPQLLLQPEVENKTKHLPINKSRSIFRFSQFQLFFYPRGLTPKMESIPTRINSPPSSNGGTAQFTTAPLPIVRSQTQSPFPTTFVQADASNFKHVVQMLTGSSETTSKQPTMADSPQRSSGGVSVPPIKSTVQKKPGFKLYERRNTLKKGLLINTFGSGYSNGSRGFSPRKHEILSPSILNFPSLVISPATPLNQDCLSRSSAILSSPTEEERAIAQKKFYLHPSSPTTPGNAEPQLLPLFPMTSPRVPESSS